MAHILRPRRSGATIFFTLCLARPGDTLLVDHITRLRAAVRAERAARPFDIAAWVVLPDHLHAIWTLPEGDSDYSMRWSAIKARFSRGFEAQAMGQSQVKRREKGIWQRRFWEHHIRDAADFHAHLRHCWRDPVRHGLCARPGDWLYTSYHRDRAHEALQVAPSGPIPRFPTGEPRAIRG